MERLKPQPGSEIYKTEPYADIRTHQFLTVSIADNAHLVTLEESGRKDTYARDRNITGIYYGTYLNQSEIGRMFSLSSTRISLILNNKIVELNGNLSKENQRKFPLGKIFITKPKTAIEREWRLHLKAKKMRELNAGKLYLSQDSAINYKSGRQRCNRIREELARVTTDEQLRKAFAKVDHSFFKNNPGEFISIFRIARNCGFMFSARSLEKFLRVLGLRNIPFGHVAQEIKSGEHEGEIHNYYFTLKRQEKRIEKVFVRANPLGKWQV